MARFIYIALCLLFVSACSSSPQTKVVFLDYLDKPLLLSHAQILSSELYQGRKSGTKENYQSAIYIKQQLIQAGIKPLPLFDDYFQPFTYFRNFSTNSGQNVVGFKPGSKYLDKYIVISAHFDHIGTKGSKVFNGADDNASGVAASLAIANALNKYDHQYSIVFLFSDAEEVNLNGSKEFLKVNDDFTDNIVLNINLDMIAGDEKSSSLRFLSYRIKNIVSQEELSRLYQMQKSYAFPIKKGFHQRHYGAFTPRLMWQLASDHGAFYRKRIPFVYYGVGLHQNYHKTTDTYDNLNKENLWHASNAIFDQLLYLDKHIKNSHR